MVKKAQRKIRSKIARGMLAWAHYRFQQRLINKTREYRQCKVLIVDESYTSNTCGSCGQIIARNLEATRSSNAPHVMSNSTETPTGARNILLNFLTDFQPPTSAQATVY
jgi:putative transposase